MTATKHMAAASKEEPCDEAFLGVNAVGKALDCFVVALVDISERSATDGASINEVKGSDTLLGRRLRRSRAHSNESGNSTK